MYLVRKKRNEQCFCVKHAQTGDVHSEHSTRKDALAQLRLLSVGGMRRHNLFGNTGLPTQQAPIPVPAPAPAPLPVFAPPRPRTPDMRQRYSLGHRADELFRREQALAPAPARAPAPASSASSSSASSASSASFTPRVTDFYIQSQLLGFVADMAEGRPLPTKIQNIFDALGRMGFKKLEPERKVAYSVALYNFGYGPVAMKVAKDNGQLKNLINDLGRNQRTLIPASRGGAKGVRGKNLNRGKLFGMTITDSGDRIPVPADVSKIKRSMKEFHASEGVPGMHTLYNVFPQGTRAKQVIPSDDLSLFNRETKLMHRDMKLKGRPFRDTTFEKHEQGIPDTPLYRAYESTRGKPPSASALRTFRRVSADI